MGAVARGTSFVVLASLLLASVVLTGGSTPSASTPGPGSLSHLSPLAGGPAIIVAPTQGPIGASFTVNGTGFNASALVNVSFSNSTFSTVLVPSGAVGPGCPDSGTNTTTNASGEFLCTYTVPSVSTSGPYNVTGNNTVNGSLSNVVVFTVTTPAITVTPGQGPQMAPVTVAGTGFTVSAPLTSLVLDGVAISTCTSGSLTTGATGAFSCTFPVPSGTSGTTVVATDSSGQTATGTFTVTTPSITVTPGQGPQGASVSVKGTGFTVSSTLSSLVFDSVAIGSCTSGSLSTNSTGGFTCGFSVPASTSGTTVSATDANGQVATAHFTVTTPAITVSPGHGPVGSPVVVKGTGFSVGTPLGSLTFDSIAITSCTSGSLTANASGDFSCTFNVPSGTSGTTVRAVDAGGQSATGSFQVTTESISVTPVSGPVGAPFVVSGTGFTASAAVRVAFGPTPVSPTTSPGCTVGSPSGTEVMTSPGGSFDCTFLVPSESTGGYPVVATDVTTSTTSNPISFEVTVPAISVGPAQGPIGADFTVSGSGFSVTSTANVAFSGDTLTPYDCTVGSASGASITTNGTGAFTCSFAVPTEGPAGYPVVATDLATSTASNSVEFTVTAVSLTVSPGQGPVGTGVTVSGTGFSVLTPIASLVFDMVTVSSCTSGSLTTGATGAFACSLTVPSGTSGSSVEATDAGGEVATTQFTVTVPALSISPNQGGIGSTFAVEGTGFQGTTPLTVTAGGPALTPSACSVGSFSGTTITTAAGGGFSCMFSVASQPGGSITLVATQGSSQASVGFVITPTFGVSSSNGGVGTLISFSGSGFAASTPFTVEWNSSTPVCTGTSGSSGEVSCSATVPNAPAGPHTVTIVQGATTAGTVFVVVPSVAVRPASGTVGSSVTVNGNGFDALASYVVTWQGTSTVCSGTTDTNGGFSCSFAVPSTPVGTATIMVSEGGNTPSYLFSVTAPPPSNSSSSAFPWWIVAVIALAVVALLILGLIFERRRHRRPRSSPSRPHGFGPVGAVEPWAETPSPTEGGPGPIGSPGLGASAGGAIVPGITAEGAMAPAPDAEDIDMLIARLERMSVQMFNKTPKQLSESSIAEAPAESTEAK
jgi:hypothetical protein